MKKVPLLLLALFYPLGATAQNLTFIEGEFDDGAFTPGPVVNHRFPHDVAVSSDGKNVYTVSSLDDALVVFTRNALTGELTLLEEIVDGGSDGNGNTADGLDFPHGVAVSPDGKHVYVAGFTDGAIAIFSRDPSDGDLTFVSAFFDAGNVLAGLTGVEEVVVSPDNEHVYAVAFGEDAINAFSRNTTTGALTFLQAIRDGDGGVVNGLQNARDVAISPDGQHLYTASGTDTNFGGDDAVGVFSRNPATGLLAFVEAQVDDSRGGTADGIEGGQRLGMSPDGMHLYVSNAIDAFDTGEEWLGVFARNTNTLSADFGKLTFVEEHLTFDTADCDESGILPSPGGVVVTPDGGRVAANQPDEGGVYLFDRNPATGALSRIDVACEGFLGGTGNVGSLAAEAGGKHLYGVSSSSQAAIALLLSLNEDFESGLPPSWTNFDVSSAHAKLGNTWGASMERANSGAQSMVATGVGETWLISAAVDLSKFTDAGLRFFENVDAVPEAAMKRATQNILYSTNYTSGANPNTATWTPLGASANPEDTWQERIFDLPNIGTAHVAFQFIGNSLSWYIDDVEVQELSVLPVELVAFEATGDGRDVLLRWATASETNNAGFAVEQSAGAGQGWRQIGFINGAGTTTAPQHYTYRLEGMEPGRYAFRLRQVDFDGAFAYSPEVEVRVEVPTTHYLSEVYPNPFNPQAQFGLAVAQRQQIRIALYDVLGRFVRSLHEGELDPETTHTFALTAEGLASGTYLLRVQGETFVESRRIVLLK